ncbi:hypothetical protein [Helicobacter sp. T3_23-1059]
MTTVIVILSNKLSEVSKLFDKNALCCKIALFTKFKILDTSFF